MKLNAAPALFLTGLLLSCNLGNPNPSPGLSSNFATQADKVPLAPGLIDEASGLVDSRTMAGYLWVQEDSGNPNYVSLLSKDGKLAGRINLPFSNRDWEDLAIGPGPQDETSYLYMADIGDNNAQYSVSYIYRFAEPKSINDKVTTYDRIAFRYPDGPRDAEALLLDPQTRDLFVITKREDKNRIYRLPYPQNTTEVMTASYLGELPLTLVTGGSVSADGREILLRTYFSVQYWQRTEGQSLADALQRSAGKSLTVEVEPQGEGIAFDREGKGFYTVSEKGNAASVTLNYYKRL